MSAEPGSTIGLLPDARPIAVLERASVARLAAWTARGGLAVADQALYAGAHFVLNVLLARWLPAGDYGAFALAYSVFLLVAALYSALVLEPMAVFGPGKYGPERRGYLGVLLRGHLVVTLPFTALLMGAAVLAGELGQPSSQSVLLALAAVTPCLLLGWLTRRAFYVEARPGWAAGGSGIYCVLVLAAALWLFRRDALTPATTVLSMGLAALAAATAQVVHLRPQWGRTCRFSVRTVARDHWHYGRWALASAAAMWFPLNVYYYVLPAASGLEAAGALKALLNLANPVLHSLVALGLLLTPSLVRQRARGGIDLMHRTVSRVAGICVLGSAVYLLLLWTFRVEAFDVLYGGRYQEYSVAPVLLAGALPLASSATITLGSALRALEQPRLVFWSYVVFCAAAVVAGAPLAATWGVTGALAGMLLSYVALVLAMWIFYGRARSRTAQEDREQSIWQESR